MNTNFDPKKLTGLKADVYKLAESNQKKPFTLDDIMGAFGAGTKRSSVNKYLGIFVKEGVLVKNEDKSFSMKVVNKKTRKAPAKGKTAKAKPAPKKKSVKCEKHDYSDCKIQPWDKVSFSPRGKYHPITGERLVLEGTVSKVYYFKPQECFYVLIEVQDSSEKDGVKVYDKRMKNVTKIK